MSAAPKTEPGVHRLLDIVVEEVSLVDRAANKHRFLIVKRSNDMDETKTGAADETAEVEDLNATAGDVETEEAGGGTAAESPAEATPGTPLAVALAALEGLTEAVEVLGSAGGEEGRERLAALAGDVRAVAEQLASLAGKAGGGAKPAATSPPKDAKPDEAAPDPKDTDPLDAAIASVRATLAQVRDLVEAGGKDAARPAEATPPAAPAAQEKAPASGPDSAAAGLASLAEQVRALAEGVKAQQQRLARIEKRFGLPNSAPAGERPGRSEDDEDVSWPLDLNRGLDRESVDKAVSFHDV